MKSNLKSSLKGNIGDAENMWERFSGVLRLHTSQLFAFGQDATFDRNTAHHHDNTSPTVKCGGGRTVLPFHSYPQCGQQSPLDRLMVVPYSSHFFSFSNNQISN